ncbi:MAG: Phosphoenolpyruvate synthase [Candidatus Moranbacteria bacterium GW2011_GWF1_44_4]|nr:MAG: Phosphoenolpyruvate synthase [Candidatus Moranbacteria bacterium GW2011_GWF1_44_4]
MFTKTFKEISKKDVGIAGGKGASLGEMTQAGISVPPGFVIIIDAFDRFLEETDLGVDIVSILKKINYKDMSSVDRASHEIRDMIHDVPMPKDLAKLFLAEFKKLKAPHVAVRSSATAEDSAVASWAGELETYLNTTEKNIFENIKKCWSSLFTQRALFYAFEKGVFSKKHQQKIRAGTSKIKDSYPVSVAVVVQKMVQSEISGVCFTVHPVTEDKNQMVIEAGYGLGEAIVSGQITPDTYVVNKREFSNIDINFSEQSRMIIKKKGEGVEWKPVSRKKQNQQKLTSKQIVELAKLCDRVEKHYKKPQDIEWALEKGNFYITQSRPIRSELFVEGYFQK